MQFLREEQFGLIVSVNNLWVSSFFFYASADIVIKCPQITNKNSFNRKWNTQHHTHWKPELLSLYFFSVFVRGRLSVKAKMTQHTWEELQSEKFLRHACLSTSGNKAETNSARPPAGHLSLRIIRQRKGLELGCSHTYTHTHSNIPRWDTPREQDDCVKGRRRFVLEVNCWAAGRSLAHRGQRAGRSPWWHAWCALRAWSPQSPKRSAGHW